MRYVTAVIIGVLAGILVMFFPAEGRLPAAVAMVMMSIYINEATILHKVEDLEGKLLKK